MAKDRQLLQSQTVEPGMVARVPAGRALERGLRQLEASRVRRGQGTLERERVPPVIDCGPEALELVSSGVVHAGADEQAVEREREVVAPTAAVGVADRGGNVLLERRAGPEAEVVVRSEVVRLA